MNILFILSDQQRWDALGVVNNYYITPFLDELCGYAVRFSQCYVNSPVCIPSRLSLATGLHPQNIGVTRNKPHDLSCELDTWMKIAKKNGYKTCAIGKTHLHRHSGDLRDRLLLMHKYGFDFVDEIAGPHACTSSRSNLTDYWEKLGLFKPYCADMKNRKHKKFPESSPLPFSKEYYPDSYVKDQFCNFLRQLKSDSPWCAFVGFSGPHEPWDAPQEYVDLYQGRELPLPRTLSSGKEMFKDSVNFKRMQRAQFYLKNEMNYKSLRRDYAASVTFLDGLIGDIFDVMKKNGSFDNTLIIFSSDHGEMNGDYGLLDKQCFFDGAVRVPLIVKPPVEQVGGSFVADDLVSLFDIAATICDYSSNKITPKDSHGFAFSKSLRPLVEKSIERRREGGRKYVVSAYKNEKMVVTQKYKFMFGKDASCYGLFDRILDPFESKNLALSNGNSPKFRKEILAAKNYLLRMCFDAQDYSRLL